MIDMPAAVTSGPRYLIKYQLDIRGPWMNRAPEELDLLLVMKDERIEKWLIDLIDWSGKQTLSKSELCHGLVMHYSPLAPGIGSWFFMIKLIMYSWCWGAGGSGCQDTQEHEKHEAHHTTNNNGIIVCSRVRSSSSFGLWAHWNRIVFKTYKWAALLLACCYKYQWEDKTWPARSSVNKSSMSLRAYQMPKHCTGEML